uniref:Uncharacterized protein n=1 Tax=Nelumbo nucifera TaxID=4432 RepID=A0A822Y5S7_NELNU|nr:TPA_asm: hypothetical protein HUJ06_030802 [Nelumbo nucifera]
MAFDQNDAQMPIGESMGSNSSSPMGSALSLEYAMVHHLQWGRSKENGITPLGYDVVDRVPIHGARPRDGFVVSREIVCFAEVVVQFGWLPPMEMPFVIVS